MGLLSDSCETKVLCDVPLYPGQWNVWELIRTMDDNPTAEQIQEELKRIFGRNVAQRLGVRVSNWLPRDDATDLAIHTFLGHSKNPADLTDLAAFQKAEWKLALQFQGSSSVILVRDLAQCEFTGPAPPGVKGKRFTRILVQFVWRGHELSTSWKGTTKFGAQLPGFPSGAGYIWDDCLNDATYILAEVWKPLASKQVPENPSDTFLGQFGNGVARLGDALEKGTKKALETKLKMEVIGGLLAAGLVFVVGREYLSAKRG